MAQDADFADQVPAAEIAIDAGIRASTATKWKNRDIELMSLIENPAFSVTKTASQFFASGGGTIQVTWESAIYDKARTGEKFDFANNRFNPKVAGEYFFNLQLFFTAAVTTAVKIRKNGTPQIERTFTVSANQSITLAGGIILNGSSDTVDVIVDQHQSIGFSIGDTPLSGSTFFQGQRIIGLGF